MKHLLNQYFLLFIFILCTLAAFLVTGLPSNQKYEYLAHSLFHGHTDFIDTLTETDDVIFYSGHQYWPLGILPAVPLVPFNVLGGLFSSQQYLSLFINAGVIFFAYYLARKRLFNPYISWWLVAALVLGSIYQQSLLLSSDWYIAHALGVFFGLWGVIMVGKKNYFLAGIGFGLAALSRELMIITALFGLLTILFSKTDFRSLIRSTLLLSIGPLIATAIIFLYGYSRFGNVLPTKQHQLANLGFVNQAERATVIANGVFSPKYIPSNFYYFFIRPFDLVTIHESRYVVRSVWPFITTSIPGVSFFAASPVFIYLLFTRLKDKESLAALLTSLPMLFILLMYYWPGWRQTSPRFLLDIYPFIYLLFLKYFQFHPLTFTAKLLVVLGVFLNLHLFVQVWFIGV